MGHPGTLNITTLVDDDAVIVTAIGEVDQITGRQLRAALGEAIRQAALQHTALRLPTGCAVVVDLTQVAVTKDDALLTALVGAANEADDRREPLRLVVNANRPVIHPMQLSGLDQFLALYNSVPEALAA